MLVGTDKREIYITKRGMRYKHYNSSIYIRLLCSVHLSSNDIRAKGTNAFLATTWAATSKSASVILVSMVVTACLVAHQRGVDESEYCAAPRAHTKQAASHLRRAPHREGTSYSSVQCWAPLPGESTRTGGGASPLTSEAARGRAADEFAGVSRRCNMRR